MMKTDKKNNALEGIKKEQLKRRVFTLEFKAEVVRHRKAGNLNFAECGRKFDVSPKMVQDWERLYEAGEFLQVQTYTHVLRWTDQIAKRPAVKRGRMVNRTWGNPDSQLPERHDAKDFNKETER